MLRKLQLTAIALFFCSALSAQNFKWTAGGGGSTYDEGVGITTDPSGNVLVTGMLESVANFSGTVLTSYGQHDIVVLKYNSLGALQWVRQAGGTEGDKAYGIVCDASGNIYVAGEFETTTNWGNGITKTSQGSNDAFIAKYDASGTVQWVTQIKGSSDERAYSLSLDGSGNVYCTGYTSSSTTNYGNNKTTSNNYGGEDIFLAKFNSSGLCQWAKRFGSSGQDRGNQVLADNNGNLFINGVYSNNANFNGTTHSSVGKTDIYFAKVTQSNGTITWMKKYGSTEDDWVYDLKKDAAGNFYQAGSFKNTTNFGGVSLTSSWNSDCFVLKTDNNGTTTYAFRMGSGYADIARGVSLDQSGNLFVCGEFGGWVNFGGVNIQSAGDMDAFVSCYDANTAAFKWVKGAGSTLYDKARGITTSSTGLTYVTGDYKNTVQFGPTSMTSNGLADIFVSQMTANLDVEPTIAASVLSSSPVDCSTLQLNWTNGNGAKRLVIARATSSTASLPFDGESYTANSAFGSGQNIGNSNYVVYDGTGSSVSVSGLTAGVSYTFSVFEYNGTGTNNNYKTDAFASVSATLNGPSVTFSDPAPSICGGGSVTITASGATTYDWSPSTGLNTTSGNVVTASPATTTTYTVVGSTGSCTDTKTITVTVGGQSAATITGLAPAYAPNSSGAYLTGSPAGGVFSGPGMTGNYFSPSAAGSGGPYNITYTVTNGSCASTATVQTTVTSQPNNCSLPPSSGSASNVTSTSALVTWNASAWADTIQLKYRVSGSPEGTSIVVLIPTPAGTPNSYQLTSLTPGTVYSVYLRSICFGAKSLDQLRIPFTTPSVARMSAEITAEEIQNIDMTTYPNPNDGIFNIRFYSVQDQKFSIRIFDLNGRVVWMNNYSSLEGENTIGVDLQNFGKGIYMVEMLSGSTVYQSKIVVQ